MNGKFTERKDSQMKKFKRAVALATSLTMILSCGVAEAAAEIAENVGSATAASVFSMDPTNPATYLNVYDESGNPLDAQDTVYAASTEDGDIPAVLTYDFGNEAGNCDDEVVVAVESDGDKKVSDCLSYTYGDGVIKILPLYGASGNFTITVTTYAGIVSKNIKLSILYKASGAKVFMGKKEIVGNTLTVVADHSVTFDAQLLIIGTTDVPEWFITDTSGNKFDTADAPAIVNKDTGVFTANKEGTVILHLKARDTPIYEGAALRNFVVVVQKNNPAVKIDMIDEDKEPVSDVVLDLNETKKLGVTLTSSIDETDATDVITWVSSDTKVATVDSTGNVTAVGKGTATITAYGEGIDSNGNRVKAECALTVIGMAKTITFKQPQYSTRVDNSVQVSATEDPTIADEELIWESSDPTVATVTPDLTSGFGNTQTATVVGKKVGTVTIYAISKYSGVKGSCTVSVTPKIEATGIEIYKGDATADNLLEDNAAVEVYNTQTLTLTAKLLSATAGVTPDDEVLWSIEGNENDAVDPKISGNVITLLGVTNGETVTVTAAAKMGGQKQTVTVKVLRKTDTAQICYEGAAVSAKSINKGSSVQLTGKLTLSNGTENADDSIVSWESSDESIVTVDQTGKITGVATGAATVKFTTKCGKTASCRITVYITSDITISGATEIQIGKSAKLTAAVTDQGSGSQTGAEVTWSSSDESIATVDQSGNVTSVSLGSVTITAKSGSKEATYDITVYANTQTDLVVAAIPDQQYIPGGEIIKPEVTVTVAGKTLVADQDYFVDYSAVTAAPGTENIYITGDGTYIRGTEKTVTFKVVAMGIDDSAITVEPIEDVVYNGTSQKLKPVVKASNGTVLTEGTTSDYTLAYSPAQAQNAGEVTVTVTGKGGFSGTTTVTYNILPLDVNDESITVTVNDALYNYGAELKPTVTVKRGTSALSATTDYTLTYENNTNAGTARAVITGKGNYTGVRTADFNVLPKSIASGVTLAAISPITYTGYPIAPETVFKSGSTELVYGTDYVAVFSDNLNAGSVVKVQLIGMGNYTGVYNKSSVFTIAKKSVSDTENPVVIADIPDQLYMGGSAICPELEITYNGNVLIENVDYVVSYTKNTSITTDALATVNFNASKNFSGTLTKNFTIVNRTVNHPATLVTIRDEAGNDVGKNSTLYVDNKGTARFTLEISNSETECDDIIMAATTTSTNASIKFVEYAADGKSAVIEVTGKKQGSFTYTAASFSGKANKTISFTILEPATSIVIKEGNTIVSDGGIVGTSENHQVELKAVMTPANTTDTVEWRVDNTELAEISQDGILTAKNAGTVIVTAKVKPTEGFPRGMEASTTVNIKQANPITSMSFAFKELNLNANDQYSLDIDKHLILSILNNTNSTTDEIIWSSSDPTVAKIDEVTGKITALGKKGTVTITAMSDNLNPVSASFTLNVSTPVTTLTFSPSNYNLTTGQSAYITVTENPATASEKLVWTSSDESVVRIDETVNDITNNVFKVKVTALKKGSCQLKAETARIATDNKPEPTQVSATCGVTVTDPIDISRVTAKLSASAYTYTGTARKPSATVYDGDALLTSGTDYTVSYVSNVNIGTATAVITGQGKYTGTKKLTFKILPAVPKARVSAATAAAIKITWNAVPQATGYVVYQAIGGKWVRVKVTSATSYTATGLKSGTNYRFTVKAYKTVGGTNYYCATYTALDCCTAPAKTTVKVGATSAGAVKLTWTKSAGATGYVVYQAIGGKWVRIKVTSATSYVVPNLKSATSYAFLVKPYKSCGGKNYYGANSNTVKTSTKPAAVKVSSFTSPSAKAVKAVWGKITGATGYQIQVSTSKTFSSGNKTYVQTALSRTVTGLTRNKTYYVRARAYRTYNGVKYYGAWSTIKYVKCK